MTRDLLHLDTGNVRQVALLVLGSRTKSCGRDAMCYGFKLGGILQLTEQTPYFMFCGLECTRPLLFVDEHR
jgi:hypothetical protein